MKNIVLLGAPKAGKSTFARMIMEKFPKYHLIDGDMIGLGYSRAVFEKARDEQIGDSIKFTVDCDFNLNVAMKIFQAFVENYPNFGFIFQSDYLSPEYAKKYLSKDNIVLILGYPNANIETILHHWKKGESKYDFGRGFSIEDKKELAKDYIDMSKCWLESAQTLGLKFVDTSYDRKEALKDLLDYVDEQMYNTN